MLTVKINGTSKNYIQYIILTVQYKTLNNQKYIGIRHSPFMYYIYNTTDQRHLKLLNNQEQT